MLMLTHTYLLQQVMAASGIRQTDPDIYIYNIAPDLLTIHPDITASRTHSIDRFLFAPADHRRTAYIMFHLLVDDLAHYGKISLTCEEGFNPHSAGYTYLKGRRLIGSLLELHKIIGRTISYEEAAYRSHLIIEMIYDLVIGSHIHADRSMDILEEAIHFTLDRRRRQFCEDIAWLYGVEKDYAGEVLKSAVSYITRERMERIMNIEGRIRLFTDKFGLRNDNVLFAETITGLFQDALTSIEDEDFLQQSAVTIREAGWLPTD
ncbi:MAG: hypothetical protein PHG54_01590 [Smithellaceae bacterium]|nr:hypothetical protein [Syntrophaceae bacterium]MDD4240096.1 hypothetical protein [Smithellaceae bacterium]NLX51460.1 hypothetical protein [Deltaproteobacteria bacterium]